jgi:hypothetical protein
MLCRAEEGRGRFSLTLPAIPPSPLFRAPQDGLIPPLKPFSLSISAEKLDSSRFGLPVALLSLWTQQTNPS